MKESSALSWNFEVVLGCTTYDSPLRSCSPTFSFHLHVAAPDWQPLLSRIVNLMVSRKTSIPCAWEELTRDFGWQRSGIWNMRQGMSRLVWDHISTSRKNHGVDERYYKVHGRWWKGSQRRRKGLWSRMRTWEAESGRDQLVRHAPTANIRDQIRCRRYSHPPCQRCISVRTSHSWRTSWACRWGYGVQ